MASFYLAIEIASVVLVFTGSGGIEILKSKSVGQQPTTSQQPPNNQSDTDQRDIEFGSVKMVNLGISMLILHVVSILPWVLNRPKLAEIFYCLIVKTTGNKELDKISTGDLKIKVNYPLFLKKSKSNMFERAMKEDFDNQKMVIKAGPLGKKSSEKDKAIRTSKGVLGSKAAINSKDSSSREKFQLSGGFFSSRGTGQRFTTKTDIESPGKVKADFGELPIKTEQLGVAKYHSARSLILI